MSHVQDWVAQSPHLWAGLWGQAVRPLDVSDDRLAEVVRQLSLPEIWEPLEGQITQRLVRVYELPTERVRLDTTRPRCTAGMTCRCCSDGVTRKITVRICAS
jgi:hypothetical protein